MEAGVLILDSQVCKINPCLSWQGRQFANDPYCIFNEMLLNFIPNEAVDNVPYL